MDLEFDSLFFPSRISSSNVFVLSFSCNCRRCSLSASSSSSFFFSFYIFFPSPPPLRLLFPLTIGRFHVRATNATSCSSSPSDGFSYFFSAFPSSYETHTHIYTAATILSFFSLFFLFSTDLSEHSSNSKKEM